MAIDHFQKRGKAVVRQNAIKILGDLYDIAKEKECAIHMTQSKHLILFMQWLDALCPEHIPNEFSHQNRQLYQKNFHELVFNNHNPNQQVIKDMLVGASVAFDGVLSDPAKHYRLTSNFIVTFARQFDNKIQFIHEEIQFVRNCNEKSGNKFAKILTKIANILNTRHDVQQTSASAENQAAVPADKLQNACQSYCFGK